MKGRKPLTIFYMYLHIPGISMAYGFKAVHNDGTDLFNDSFISIIPDGKLDFEPLYQKLSNGSYKFMADNKMLGPSEYLGYLQIPWTDTTKLHVLRPNDGEIASTGMRMAWINHNTTPNTKIATDMCGSGNADVVRLKLVKASVPNANTGISVTVPGDGGTFYNWTGINTLKIMSYERVMWDQERYAINYLDKSKLGPMNVEKIITINDPSITAQTQKKDIGIIINTMQSFEIYYSDEAAGGGFYQHTKYCVPFFKILNIGAGFVTISIKQKAFLSRPSYYDRHGWRDYGTQSVHIWKGNRYRAEEYLSWGTSLNFMVVNLGIYPNNPPARAATIDYQLNSYDSPYNSRDNYGNGPDQFSTNTTIMANANTIYGANAAAFLRNLTILY